MYIFERKICFYYYYGILYKQIRQIYPQLEQKYQIKIRILLTTIYMRVLIYITKMKYYR